MWQQILDFAYNNWFKLAFVVWLLAFVKGGGNDWVRAQLEWVKGLFIDDDDTEHPDAPSHKNAILLALAVVFIIGFVRKLALSDSPEIPDIPIGWQLALLAGLGIAAAKTGAQKLFENKFGNGNGNGIKEPPKS